MYGDSSIDPRSATATVAIELAIPCDSSRVPSIGSTAMSVFGSSAQPRCSPSKSIGALSFAPSPMTTTPSIGIVFSTTAHGVDRRLIRRLLLPPPHPAARRQRRRLSHPHQLQREFPPDLLLHHCSLARDALGVWVTGRTTDNPEHPSP